MEETIVALFIGADRLKPGILAETRLRYQNCSHLIYITPKSGPQVLLINIQAMANSTVYLKSHQDE